MLGPQATALCAATRAAAFRGRSSRTRSIQRLLNDLLGWLPRLGLIRETCQLLDLAQELESINPVGAGAVTEFDRLFENGYQAIVRAIVESARDWKMPADAPADRDPDHMLVDVLQQLTERQLDRWLTHSRTLRLSIVEKLATPDDWRRFVKFVAALRRRPVHAEVSQPRQPARHSPPRRRRSGSSP